MAFWAAEQPPADTCPGYGVGAILVVRFLCIAGAHFIEDELCQCFLAYSAYSSYLGLNRAEFGDARYGRLVPPRFSKCRGCTVLEFNESQTVTGAEVTWTSVSGRTAKEGPWSDLKRYIIHRTNQARTQVPT